MKKINISMLSEQNNTSPEAQYVMTNDALFENMNGDLDQMHIAMTDLEHIDEVVAEAIQVSDELMDEEAALTQAQEEGVGQPALESLQRNVNNLLRQVGIEEHVNFTALSYHNRRHNRAALESAVDDVRASLVRIHNAIKAAIAKTMDIVKVMLKKYFDAAVKIKKNCEIIKTKAIGLKGKVHRTGERVGGAHLSKYARFNNRPIEPGELVSNYDKWTAHNYNFIASVAGKTALSEYRANLEKLADYFSSIGIGTSISDIKQETDSFGDLMIQRIVSNFQYHRDGVHTTTPYIGDVVYKFNESNISFSIENIEKYKDLGNVNTHVPMDTTQVVIMCDKLIQHMKHYDQINVYFDELDSLSRMATKVANNAISGKGDLDFVQRKAISAGSSFTVRIFIDAIRKVGLGARQYDMQVSAAIMQWCAASVNTL